jgi:spore coat polysaccharide biosynthesis protein SpsF (cytidylyltransferase family)
MPNVIAIIQARLGSTRLPNKVLLQIPPESGVCMLELTIRKVLLATLVDEVAVVTPDQKIADLCTRWNIDSFMPTWEGRDVVREYYEAARQLIMGKDVYPIPYKDIVRATGDCPLIRPDIIDKCIEAYGESDCDIAFNTDESTGQLNGEGSDTEIFSYDALIQAYHKAEGDEREHPTLWMRRNLKTLFVPNAPLGIRSVNTKDDYEFVCDYVKEIDV